MNHWSDMKQILQSLRNEGKKIVFTNGCFDVIHPGHVLYLKEAKALGDVLVVGLNSDDSVKRLKGPERPINSQEDRMVVLQALKPVDYVVLFDEDTPEKLIMEVEPDVLTKGGDYLKENVVGAEFVEKLGGVVVILPFVRGKSTTSIVEKIKQL